MSDRPLIIPTPNNAILSAVSMGASINGPVTIIRNIPGLSYDISWTGSPVGTFAVQVSNSYFTDPQGNVIGTPNWTSLPTASFSGTYPVPSGSASNGFLDVVGTEAYACRLVYTRTSGTGALTVFVAAKVL